MDLAKQAKIVDGIHDTLNDFVGQRLKVRANMGRSKIVESEGVLTQVHPQLFIMEVDRKRGRTARQSYQYVDVLTGMVELSQNGEPPVSLTCGVWAAPERGAAVRAVRGRVDGAGGLPVGRACGLLSETVDNRFEIGQTTALRESAHLRGDVAQLGEHHVRNVGVVGSNPIISTTEMTRASGDRGPLCFAGIPSVGGDLSRPLPGAGSAAIGRAAQAPSLRGASGRGCRWMQQRARR